MWVADVAMSALFFVVLIVLYVQFSSNLTTTSEATMDSLSFDADVIGETLVSEGYPPNWNSTTVQRLGLTNGDHRLNLTKLQYVANISYYDRKYLFGTVFDYYVLLEQTDANRSILNITRITGLSNIGLSAEGGVGEPNVTLSKLQTVKKPDYQVRTVRYLIYNASTIRLIVYLWK